MSSFLPPVHLKGLAHCKNTAGLGAKKSAKQDVNLTSVGSLNASVVHPREIFKIAYLANSASIIISHNHPSGDPTPSQEDLAITRRLVDAGNILGIEIKDHIILGTDGSYLSFKEKGLI